MSEAIHLTGVRVHNLKNIPASVPRNRITDTGNSFIVIEHNLDVICQADRIIDMGPEGGSNGGEIIATGTPEEILANTSSVTGRYLKDVFSTNSVPVAHCGEVIHE